MTNRPRYPSALVLLIIAAATSAATPPERSVSASRQFVVYGVDVRLRGAMCDLAEQTKKQLLELIGSSDNWKAPIIINAQLPQANVPELPPAKLTLSQTEAGLKLQLDVMIEREIAVPDLRREILRGLLLELIYREQPNIPAGSSYTEAPPWLLEGIATLQEQRGAPDLFAALAPLVAEKRVAPLSEIVGRRPELLNAASRALYRAYAAALVDLITTAPDGAKRLGQFIRDSHDAPSDPVEDFIAHFPAFRDPATWANGLARMSSRESYHLLTSSDSDAALERLLTVEVRVDARSTRKYRIEELVKARRTPALTLALQHLRQELMLLQVRANPMYRPIIRQYEEAAALLARGRMNIAAKRLARATADRAAVHDRLSRIDDYLNWFEATQARNPSGVFADYIRAAQPEKSEHRRRDPISVYLDTLEAQLGD